MPAKMKTAARETTNERRARLAREALGKSKPAAKAPKAKTVTASAPALASPRVSLDRLALAKFVVATRAGKGGSKASWSDVADAVEKREGSRPTGSMLRRLFYLGGGERTRSAA
jgi:hypothetical protein